jgi:hypothetical protein
MFDVIEIHGVGNPRPVMDATTEARIGIVADTPQIAFKEAVIGDIEANQCDEQADIGFRRVICKGEVLAFQGAPTQSRHSKTSTKASS